MVVAALGLAALAGGCSTHHPAALKPLPKPKAHHAVVVAVSSPAGTTLVATTDGSIPGSPAPGAPSNLVVPGSWYGYPSVLPVIASRPNWVEVRLAQRPNGSTTWVPQRDVSLAVTPYEILIDLATRNLTVLYNGTQILSFPVGVGVPATPTVTGDYFVAMKAAAPSPGYGPFVLVTSAHSDAITDWEQSGDAIIAIHGPITAYDDSLIGTTGAAISNGCIRMHDADLAQLGDVPAGTPVDIVAS
jgi:lipoprotein-anchoring transpeptidase ErfK/SrfK